MTYTIISARYANQENTAAVIKTVEAADVLVSATDTPTLWNAMLAWGTPSPYEIPPDSQEPDPVEKLRAFFDANPDVRDLVLSGDGAEALNRL